MNIQDKVENGIRESIISKDNDRLRTYRDIKSALVVEMKSNGSDSITDEKSIVVLRRLAKQRKESIDLFTNAGRNDLALLESSELNIIEEFLPSLAGEKQIRIWIQEAIDSGAKSIGAIIGFVMKAHKKDADGTLVKNLAQEML